MIKIKNCSKRGISAVGTVLEYDDYTLPVIGKKYIIWSRTDVSPNSIRSGNDIPELSFSNEIETGIGGNSNPNIQRYHGWRGTTNDISIDAFGVRRCLSIKSKKYSGKQYANGESEPDHIRYWIRFGSDLESAD